MPHDAHIVDYCSIFAPSTPAVQQANFTQYWQFMQQQDRALLEAERDLAKKRQRLQAFQAQPVRSRQPFPDPTMFARNALVMRNDPATLPRPLLLLTALYKVARHEWVGITSAWDHTPPLAQGRVLLDHITRYHLAEEFCHARLFEEMFRVFHLEEVIWHPMGPLGRLMYQGFIALPGWLMYAPAFVSELMGFVLYWEVDDLLDDVFVDEPEVCQRLRALLHEVMVDELAHIGLRRNFLGPRGVQVARSIVAPMIRLFFRHIPESPYLFNVPRMISRAQHFAYRGFRPGILEKSWVPSYCQVPAPAL